MKSALLLPFLVIATGCDSSYTVPPRGDAGGERVGRRHRQQQQRRHRRHHRRRHGTQDARRTPAPAATPAPGSDARVTLDGGPRQTLRYVINELTLPTSTSAYAFDHDGDGSTENQYGGIVALMAQSGASLQAVMTASLAAGEDLQLISLDTSDPTLLADTAPVLRQHVAITSSGPDFTGSGSFAVNSSKPAAVYPGILFGAQYASTLPRTLTAPPTVHLRLPIGDGRTALLPLVGARLEAHVTSSGLVEGRLHGAWRQSDVNSIVLPAIAAQLNAIAQQVPCSQLLHHREAVLRQQRRRHHHRDRPDAERPRQHHLRPRPRPLRQRQHLVAQPAAHQPRLPLRQPRLPRSAGSVHDALTRDLPAHPAANSEACPRSATTGSLHR